MIELLDFQIFTFAHFHINLYRQKIAVHRKVIFQKKIIQVTFAHDNLVGGNVFSNPKPDEV